MRQLKITQQITKRESASLTKYLNEVSAIRLLSPEEEIEVSKKSAEGDLKATQRLVESNLRFVISVAKQYQGHGSLEELIQAGNIGLMSAARKFDPSRGFKFISYAVWWIRQSILQQSAESGKIIRLPSNKITATNKVKTVISKLEQELHRSPSPDEILVKLNSEKDVDIDISDLEILLSISNGTSSLDAPVSNDSESTTTLIDYITSGDDKEGINLILKSQDLNATLRRILNKKLTPREREVIISYFGLFGTPEKTLTEIGEAYELSRERVRQIKEKCLRKLKFKANSNLIKEYL